MGARTAKRAKEEDVLSSGHDSVQHPLNKSLLASMVTVEELQELRNRN